MKNLFLGLACFAALASCTSIGSNVVENDEHPFPESMFATLSSLAYPVRDPTFAAALKVYKVPVKGFRAPLPIWYWSRPGAKLTFVLLSGYGGNPESNVVQAIALQFWRQGYSVLSLPSSTHEEFAKAASKQRRPGHLPRDMIELGAALDEVRLSLGRTQSELLSTRWALSGVSYGAVQTVHAAQSVRPLSATLNFEAFIAFNPPVRLSFAMQRLDARFAEGAPRYLNADASLNSRMKSKLQAAQARQLYWSETLAAFTPHELEFLLALDFRESLLRTISWPNPDPRSLSFAQYLESQVFPSLSPRMDFAAWAKIQDLRHPETPNEVHKFPPSLLVFHSLNDPLCTPEDIVWLKGQLGTQMQLYRQGGHLGYVWSERFANDLGQSLLPLKAFAATNDSGHE